MNPFYSKDHKNTTDPLQHYEDEGWKMVKADPNTKGGVDTEWQSRKVSVDAIRAYLRRGGGVGLQCGKVSNWLCVADADHELAIATAPAFLPETLKAGKGDEVSHWFMYSEGLGYAQFNDLDGKRLIDIKASENGAGHLVVVAPTRHPTKGPYGFVGGFNPAAIAHVPADELARRVRLWACSTLVAANLPKTRDEGEGGRHDISNAIAGFGLRNGWTENETLKVLTAAWEARRAPREALQSLERNVADTARKIAANEPATGGRKLEELMPGMPGRIAKFMGWERADLRETRKSYMRTDLGNAERFIDTHRDRVMWCGTRKAWLVWDGTRWVWDDRRHVVTLAHKAARSIFADAQHTADQDEQKAITKWAMTSQSESRINAMLSQANPYLAVGIDELDTDPWVINCQNGTLDLRTGELRRHSPADLITKIVPVAYDSDAKAPRFERFLEETLVDEDVITFVKRFSGYTLTGDTSERLFAILYGVGKNGKTTLVELLQRALGDYATNTDTETILTKRHHGISNDVAALKGARFVSAAEVEQNRRLAESKVKQLTGSDTVTARFLHGEFFDFKPQFKLWLSTNNKPVIVGTDDAIWDRIRLIPFTQRFEGASADKDLPRKLREELPGVLAWMVAGCLEWQEHGLGEPEIVREATDQYRTDMDTLAAFIDECCAVGDDLTAAATQLYQLYRSWCDDNGEVADKQKMFGMRLSERGFENFRFSSGTHKGKKGWRGIGIRVNHPDPDDGAGPTFNTSKTPHSGPAETDDGSPGERLGDDGSLPESRTDMRNTRDGGEEVNDGEPKNDIFRATQPRVNENLENGSPSFTVHSPTPTDPPKDATTAP